MRPTKGIFYITYLVLWARVAGIVIKVPIFVLVGLPENIRSPKEVLISVVRCRKIKSLLVADEVL